MIANTLDRAGLHKAFCQRWKVPFKPCDFAPKLCNTVRALVFMLAATLAEAFDPGPACYFFRARPAGRLPLAGDCIQDDTR